MTQAKDVIAAEKGDVLSPHNLHLRLRMLEIVTLLSLVLNLTLWYFAGNINTKVEERTSGAQNVQTQR